MRLQNNGEVAGVIVFLCFINFLFSNSEKILKYVYIYGSYRKIKTGVYRFLDHSVHCKNSGRHDITLHGCSQSSERKEREVWRH